MNQQYPFSRPVSSVTPGDGEASQAAAPVPHFSPAMAPRLNGFRADQALVSLAELFTRRIVEPALGRKVWASGVGEVVEQAIADSRISTQLIRPVDIARAVGLLKPGRGRR
jgi:hypothetical protein